MMDQKEVDLTELMKYGVQKCILCTIRESPLSATPVTVIQCRPHLMELCIAKRFGGSSSNLQEPDMQRLFPVWQRYGGGWHEAT